MNGFLVTLDNNATPPVNGSSVVGNVLWPAVYAPRTFNADETAARAILFGTPSSRLLNFTTAIQLLWVVENSVLKDRIVDYDPLITYSDTQLVGQFAGVALSDRQVVSTALASFDTIPFSFLADDLMQVYANSLSRLDRLAAIIVHFGTKS